MAGQKISNMPIKATLSASDLVPVVSSVPTGQDANYGFNLFDSVTYTESGTGAETVSVPERLRDIPINAAKGFGITAGTGLNNTQRTANVTAFNNAIAAANTQSRMLYLPSGTYEINATLNTLTGPGLYGDGPGLSAIHLYATGSGLVTKGSHKILRDFWVINKTAAGTGTADKACVHLKNCSYGQITNVFTAHDLNNYSGIALEQEYTGSADDAALIAHLGCWYNRFTNCSTNYTSFAGAKGYGIRLFVNANAIGVPNPPGQTAGTYSGSCDENIIDLPNIEQRVIGLLFERSNKNQVRSGQFLSSATQVGLIDSSNNIFFGTTHNQWTTEPFNESGTSARNAILLPTLTSGPGAQPWSLGTLSPSTLVIRGDQKGTWTPKFFIGTTQIPTTKAAGQYECVNGAVAFTFDVTLGTIPTVPSPPTGGLSVQGLPFTSVADSNENGGQPIMMHFFSRGTAPASSAGKNVVGYTAGTETITAIGDDAGALTEAHIDSLAHIMGSGSYFTSDR